MRAPRPASSTALYGICASIRPSHPLAAVERPALVAAEAVAAVVAGAVAAEVDAVGQVEVRARRQHRLSRQRAERQPDSPANSIANLALKPEPGPELQPAPAAVVVAADAV